VKCDGSREAVQVIELALVFAVLALFALLLALVAHHALGCAKVHAKVDNVIEFDDLFLACVTLGPLLVLAVAALRSAVLLKERRDRKQLRSAVAALEAFRMIRAT
jgi:predicted membrane protein